MKSDSIKDVLLSDYSITRSQIRASEEWHVKISLIFTLSVITATLVVVSIDQNTLNIDKRILFGLINLIIIAQLSLLLNYHFFYLQLWASYVQLIESKINMLFDNCNLIEFESSYASLYFHQKASKSIFSFKQMSNKLLILFIHLPVLTIYFYGTYAFSEQFNNKIEQIIVYIIFTTFLLILFILYAFVLKAKGNQLEENKKILLKNFQEWLIRNDLAHED